MPPMVDEFGLMTTEFHSFLRGDCPDCAELHGCSWCAQGLEHCDGVLVTHRDGSESCTAVVCVGLPDVEHPSGMSCGMLGPCDRCDR